VSYVVNTPTKCDTCTSVMFGLVRQGLVCKSESTWPHVALVPSLATSGIIDVFVCLFVCVCRLSDELSCPL